jgi:hypothetical protein
MSKIGIIHLSDIHLKVGRNAVSNRTSQIVSAASAHDHEVEHWLIIISGDVAYSGKKEEYEIASQLIANLKKELGKLSAKLHAEIVIVPGNHDCSFSEPNSIREMFLANQNANKERLDSDIITACLKNQIHCLDFMTSHGGWRIKEVGQNIFNSKTINLGERRLLINACNTAWISREKEKQGELFVPIDLVKVSIEAQCDACITVFHHPYNWLEAINARAFRSRVEEVSDLILTGHEHEGGVFRRVPDGAVVNDYIEGHVLQDSHDREKSAFNVIVIDFSDRSFEVVQYGWVTDYYKASGSPDKRQFSNHSKSLVGAFEPSDRFRDFLDDPGARYSHPVVGYVTLSQIFTSPDFREISETDSPKLTHNAQVEGRDAFRAFLSRSRVLISGTEKSGRTCMAKRLCSRLLQDGNVPVFVSTSKESQSLSITGFDQLLEKLFREQYAPSLWDRYTQLPRDRKVIVVDDFHMAPVNRKGKALLLERFRGQFGKIVILSDESLRLEDLSSRTREGALLDGFSEYQILEYGRALRDRIITNWITLGRETEIDEGELAAKIKSYAHAIDIVLGKNLIPSYPVFILVLLQQLEASASNTTATGSYGYFYEYLITQSLSGKQKFGDVDLKYNYISELAWELRKIDRKMLTEMEFFAFNTRYNEDYRLTIPHDKMLGDLLDAGVLLRNSSGEIVFKYKYNYCYFVARWLAQNVATAEARKHISSLAAEIHREEYANILIFLSYLSKDGYILETILSYSKTLYSDVSPCDLSEHTKYLNSLQNRVPDLVYDEVEHSKSRERTLRAMDEDERKEQEREEARQSAELLKINQAFKTVDVLGQILKNYAGSMKGDQKIVIARECVAVALRSMNFFLSLLENNLQGFVDYLVKYYSKTNKIEDKGAIVEKAKGLIFFLAHMWAMGIIKRVSRAAGSQQLELIYTELNKEFGSASVSLIDLSVRLDHFNVFPAALVEEVHLKLRDNFFADSILRRLVVMHFYLFPVDFKVRDSICEKLEIKVDRAKVLDSRNKK